MAKYYVTYRINGYFDVEVEAESLEAAKNKANEMVMEADFGQLIDVESELRDAWEE